MGKDERTESGNLDSAWKGSVAIVMTSVISDLYSNTRSDTQSEDTYYRKNRIRSFLWRTIITCYAAILFLLNFIRIFDNNFWGDEAFSIRLAQMKIVDAVQATANDVHPPLYYIFLIAACRMLGGHDWVYHAVSLLPYLFSLVFFLTIVYKEFGKTTSALLVTFSSILSNAIVYNVEVRMYSWAALFVMLSFYSLHMVIRDGKQFSYFCFILSSLAAAYTHYYALFAVAFFYLVMLFLAARTQLKWKNVFFTYLFTLVGYLPWLMALIITFERTSESFWVKGRPGIKSCFLYFFSSPSELYSAVMIGLTFVTIVISILFHSEVIQIEYNSGKYHVHIKKSKLIISDVEQWLLCGLGAAVWVIAVGELISIFVQPSFLTRYLYPITPVVWIVFSVSISRLETKIRDAYALGILILTLAVCLPGYAKTYLSDKEENEVCAATAEYASTEIGQDDDILTNDPHLAWTILDYYFPGIDHTYVADLDEDLKKCSSDTTYWLMWSSDIDSSEMKLISTNGYAAEEKYHAGILGTRKIHLYKLTRLSPDQ
jgi:hypothetical protein